MIQGQIKSQRHTLNSLSAHVLHIGSRRAEPGENSEFPLLYVREVRNLMFSTARYSPAFHLRTVSLISRFCPIALEQ